jgi:hypothetical protein
METITPKQSFTRNAEKMVSPAFWSDSRVIKIQQGAKFEIVDTKTLVVTIKNAIGDSYVVDKGDIKKYFTNNEVVAKKVAEVNPVKPCTCDSLDLREFGCTCGSIENKLEDRILEMWTDLMGVE